MQDEGPKPTVSVRTEDRLRPNRSSRFAESFAALAKQETTEEQPNPWPPCGFSKATCSQMPATVDLSATLETTIWTSSKISSALWRTSIGAGNCQNCAPCLPLSPGGWSPLPAEDGGCCPACGQNPWRSPWVCAVCQRTARSTVYGTCDGQKSSWSTPCAKPLEFREAVA